MCSTQVARADRERGAEGPSKAVPASHQNAVSELGPTLGLFDKLCGPIEEKQTPHHQMKFSNTRGHREPYSSLSARCEIRNRTRAAAVGGAPRTVAACGSTRCRTPLFDPPSAHPRSAFRPSPPRRCAPEADSLNSSSDHSALSVFTSLSLTSRCAPPHLCAGQSVRNGSLPQAWPRPVR